VLTPLDALGVLVAVRHLLTPGTVGALLLDPGFRPSELALADDDDELEDRTRVLLDLCAGATAGIVLASRARGAEPLPVARDVVRFTRLRAHGEACGATLLDWFLLGEHQALSFAGLTESAWRWPVPHSG
jgi:hypothetical protein